MIRALVSCACVMNEILAPSFSLSERGLNRSPFWAKKQGKRKGKKNRKINRERRQRRRRWRWTTKETKIAYPLFTAAFPLLLLFSFLKFPLISPSAWRLVVGRCASIFSLSKLFFCVRLRFTPFGQKCISKAPTRTYYQQQRQKRRNDRPRRNIRRRDASFVFLSVYVWFFSSQTVWSAAGGGAENEDFFLLSLKRKKFLF